MVIEQHFCFPLDKLSLDGHISYILFKSCIQVIITLFVISSRAKQSIYFNFFMKYF